MKPKKLTIVCADAGSAAALAQEYAEIGRATVRRGRYLTVTTRELS